MNERVAVVSPIGPGREFVRNGSEWMAYYPEQRVVLVQTRNRSYGFLTALNGLERGIQSLLRDQRWRLRCRSMAGRRGASPWSRATTLRYGYRFWLDEKTALPLKTQLVARSGEVIEEISFLSLTLPETIADEQLKPEVDATHFRWMRRDTPIYTPGLQEPSCSRAVS